jgi:serine/threonine protein kinase
MTEETIFLAALDMDDPARRASYLDEACAGNPALRQRIEALLRSHREAGGFLDVPAVVRQTEEEEKATRTTCLPADREADTASDTLSLLTPAGEAGLLGRLDHYEVLEVVGRGGMGVVFRARDSKLQRIVAIKVLAPQLAANATARKRFVREAQAAAAVRDDHVVDIHAVSDDGKLPYLVMEFIAGITLAERVRQSGPLEVKEILRIGMQAARGLAAAHAQGLIHRDVTPGNILLENGVQRVKITDFGLARASAGDAGLTQSGVIAGTPLYMSPEQARGEPLDQRSDLFSLGSVLYTLCTGSPAFQAGNMLGVMKRVCEEAPRPIREINPDIPESLAAIVTRLLAKASAERFQSAAEVADLLGQHLARLQQPGLPPSAPPRRRRRLAMAVVLVAVAIILLPVAILARTWLFPPADRRPENSMPVSKATPRAAEDPRVLTVSKKAEDGGRFRTITNALEEVEPGMTIRILDDAVYEERLLINRREQQRGVVLESTGKATIRPRLDRDNSMAVRIRGVPGFTLRRLRFESSAGSFGQVGIYGFCPGVVLDQLTMTGDKNNACVQITDVSLLAKDAPIVIQNCTLRNTSHGILIEGLSRKNVDHPVLCGHLVIRNNTLMGCEHGIGLLGAVYRTHFVGNRILDSPYAAIDFKDLLPGTADILVANNTLMRNALALRLWDDSTKGMHILKCKNMRFQNNLVLEPQRPRDLIFLDHRRGPIRQIGDGDVSSLLKSPQWRFSHNWRETTESRALSSPDAKRWIPACPQDHLQVPISAGSRKPSAPNFLRPPKGSPLATAGAGVDDKALPSYVGAVPPEGVAAWDWDRTWKALTR